MVGELESISGTNNVVYFPWSTNKPIRMTFNILGPNGLGFTPHGTALVQYFDPYSNRTVVQSFRIGGSFGASRVSVVTGSLSGKGAGAVQIRVVDDPDLPKFLNRLTAPFLPSPANRILRMLGLVNRGVSGVFGTPGYYVSHATSDSSGLFQLIPGAHYRPGFLESRGIDPTNLPADLQPIVDNRGNFLGVVTTESGISPKPLPSLRALNERFEETGISLDEFMRLAGAENSGEPADRDTAIDMVATFAVPRMMPNGRDTFFAVPSFDEEGAFVRDVPIVNAKGEPMEFDFQEVMMRRGGSFARDLQFFGEGPFRRLPDSPLRRLPRTPSGASSLPRTPPAAPLGASPLPGGDQTVSPEPGAKPGPQTVDPSF